MKNATLTLTLAAVLALAASPASAAVRMFLLAGQSNMAGHEAGLPSAPYDAIQSVHFWNAGNDGWGDLKPGFGCTAGDIGPEVGFGYQLHNRVFPNDEIYLVKWGVDSTSLAGPWNPNGSGSAYNTFKSRVQAAMASLVGRSPEIAGMIWMQGETDANNSAYANAYAANLANLIAKVRSDFATPDMPFVVGRITDLSVYGFPGAAQVRTAQETVPGQVGHASWINTDDIDMNPAAPGHYSASGQIELGIRFANEFITTPEPGTLTLIGMALAALAVFGWMKRLRRPAACVLLLILAVSALSANAASAAVIRIMPVGDSITAGYTNATSWTIPFTFGYRGPLYTKLKNAGYDFQFVGVSGEPWSLPFGAEFGVPTSIQGPDLRTVGQDNHRGYGGATTSQILNGGVVSGSTNHFPGIAGMLNADNPDIVLLMIGTNGLTDAMNSIDSLVRTIVTTKPDTQLIVAKITPRSSYQADMIAYNNKVASTVAKYAALGNHVTLVDQYSNLLINPNDPTSINTSLICPDGAHLRPAANELLAQTWFEGIQAVTPAPEPGTVAMLITLGLALAAGFLVRRRWLPASLAAVLMMAGNASAVSLRIMPLGDSITAGTTDSSWDIPFSFGYRGPLYTRLSNAGYDFQFVGQSPEPWNGAPYGVPPVIVGPDLRTSGQNGHRGYGGSVIADITNGSGYDPGIAAAMQADKPDMVLLMIGINDIARYGNGGDPADAKNRLATLTGMILAAKPDVKLIVAQINPYKDGSLTASVLNYNAYVRNTLVPGYVQQGYHVSTVDQYANFVATDGTIRQNLYSNIIHPNLSGYQCVADTWFDGIKTAAHAPEPSGLCLASILGLALAGYGWRRIASRARHA
jgi:lysophospholipase L1-like esterase